MPAVFVWALVASTMTQHNISVPPTPLHSLQQCVDYHNDLIRCGLLSPRSPASCFRYAVGPEKTTIVDTVALIR